MPFSQVTATMQGLWSDLTQDVIALGCDYLGDLLNFFIISQTSVINTGLDDMEACSLVVVILNHVAGELENFRKITFLALKISTC